MTNPIKQLSVDKYLTYKQYFIRMINGRVAAIFMVILSFATAFYFYPSMPDMVVSHWDAQGIANGYMSKFWGLFLMPIVALAALILMLVIPRIDPKRDNIEKFGSYFSGFIALFMLFFYYI